MRTPTFIAEISANHLGSLPRALKLVEAAARAGADAVKLQTFDPDRMVGNAECVVDGGLWAGRKLAELYREAVTPRAWHKRLFAHAKEFGIEAFSSAFSYDDVDFLEELGCPIYKIASFELVDLSLIQFAAKTGKPVILSTGMATLGEVEEAVEAAIGAGCRDLTLLKCSSAYPAPMSSVNLATIPDLLDYFPGVSVGFSDHTRGIGAPVAAVAIGATVIEKHITLARHLGGPDAEFSAEPDEFAAMVTAGREALEAIGTIRYGPTEAETPSLRLRRSLWWGRAGKAGACVPMHCVRTARPALGLHPRELSRIVGKRLARDVSAGQPVREEDFG